MNRTGFAAWLLALAVVGVARVDAQTVQWITWDGSPAGTPPVVDLAPTSDKDSTTFTITLHGFYVQESYVGSVPYHRVIVPSPNDSVVIADFDPQSSPQLSGDHELGRPELPQLPELVGVVTNASTPLLDPPVVDAYFQIDTFNSHAIQVWPLQPGAGLCSCCDDPGPFQIDQAFYDSFGDFYPPAQAEISGMEGWMSLKVGCVQANLAQYQPTTHTLRMAKVMHIHVHHEGAALVGNQAPDTSPDLDQLFNSVVNFKKVKAYFNALFQVQYLILVHDDLAAAIEPLRLAKIAEGYGVTVKKVPSDVENTRADIQSEIQTFYDNARGLADRMVLIVGDANHIVPKSVTRSDGEEGVSDKPYSLVFGDDKIPDLCIGRISADTPAEVTDIVRKILRYETAPPQGDWAKNVLLVGAKGDMGHDFLKEQCEVIKDYLNPSPLGPLAYLIPGEAMNRDECFRNAPALPAGTNAQVSDLIKGGVGIVAYLGHGCPDRWENWNAGNWATAQVLDPALHNGCFNPIVFAMCCYNNKFDNADLPTDDCGKTPLPGTTDGIGEEWMQVGSRKGAVAHYGATMVAWDRETFVQNRELFIGIYDREIRRVGYVLMREEELLLRRYPLSKKAVDNVMVFELMGDPSMNLRTGNLPAPPPPPAPEFKDATCLKTGKPCADPSRYDAAKSVARVKSYFLSNSTDDTLIVESSGFALDRNGSRKHLVLAKSSVQRAGYRFLFVRAQFGAEYGNGAQDCNAGGPSCGVPALTCAPTSIIDGQTVYADPNGDWAVARLDQNAAAGLPLAAGDAARHDMVYMPMYPAGGCKVVSQGSLTDAFPAQVGHTADDAAGGIGAPLVLDMPGNANRHKAVGLNSVLGQTCADARAVPVSALLRATIPGGIPVVDSVIASLDGTQQSSPGTGGSIGDGMLDPVPMVYHGGRLRYTIRLGSEADVTLRLFDIAGRQVAEVFRGPLKQGEHRQEWSLPDRAVSAGVYFLRFSNGRGTQTRTVVLLE
jgi:hypothetical protein